MKSVEGITNHGSLFTEQEELGRTEEEILKEKLEIGMRRLEVMNDGAGR